MLLGFLHDKTLNQNQGFAFLEVSWELKKFPLPT